MLTRIYHIDGIRFESNDKNGVDVFIESQGLRCKVKTINCNNDGDGLYEVITDYGLYHIIKLAKGKK